MNDQRYDSGMNPHVGERQPASARARPITHVLFPRPIGAGPETRDIQFVGIMRRLPVEEAKRLGHKVEYCPHDIPVEELPDWAAVHARFGGGQYKVAAKDGEGHIHCWSPSGEGDFYNLSGRSKSLAGEDVELADGPTVSPLPAPVAAAPRESEEKESGLAKILMMVAQMQQTSSDRQMQMQQEAAQRQQEAANRHAQLQQEASDRQMQMLMKMSEQTNQLLLALLNRRDPGERQSEQTNQMFLALLNRPDPTQQLISALLNRPATPAPAAPAIDPLAGVKLGAELKGAQPAVATPVADPIAQMRGTIELVKEMQGLAPTGGGGAADAAEVSTIFNGLSSLVNGLKANSPQAPEPAPSAQTRVLINGRYLTPDQAALEYSRLSAGPPVVSPVAAPVAPPAPGAAAVISPAAPPAPVAPPAAAPVPEAPAVPVIVPVVHAPTPASSQVDEVLALMRDPAFAAAVQARIAVAPAASPTMPAAPSATPLNASSDVAPSGAVPAQPAPGPAAPPSVGSTSPASPNVSASSVASSNAAPSNVAPSNVAPSSAAPLPAIPSNPPSSPVTEALAAMPQELVGHVAHLDPGQFVALAKMHPDAIARSVRGLQGMDDDKARMFGEAIGNLPPEALPLLSQALPAEARKFLGLVS
jgi:hypothetical protein